MLKIKLSKILFAFILILICLYLSKCISSDKDEKVFAFVEETGIQENVENLPEEFNWENLPKNNLRIISAKTHESRDITITFNLWIKFYELCSHVHY